MSAFFLLTRTWAVIGGVAELGVGAPQVARLKFTLVPEYLVKPRQQQNRPVLTQSPRDLGFPGLGRPPAG